VTMGVHPIVTASTMIAQFFWRRKVRCHTSGLWKKLREVRRVLVSIFECGSFQKWGASDPSVAGFIRLIVTECNRLVTAV
jgi:hypothetical protein